MDYDARFYADKILKAIDELVATMKKLPSRIEEAVAKVMGKTEDDSRGDTV